MSWDEIKLALHQRFSLHSPLTLAKQMPSSGVDRLPLVCDQSALRAP
jgi:hypothetical protein